jgi:trimeric autotransporter adhesin
MSTKTTFKRIALVAVAALGLGVVSSVAPATAVERTPSIISVASDGALRAGVAGSITATFTLPAGYAIGDSIIVGARVTSAPATSFATSKAAVPGTAAISSTAATSGTFGWAQASSGSGSYASGDAINNAAYNSVGTAADGTSNWTAAGDYVSATGDSTATQSLTLNFTPDASGSYTILFYVGSTAGAYNTAGELQALTNAQIAANLITTTATFATGSTPTTAAITALQGTTITGATGAALYKLTLTDAAGAVASLGDGESITLASTTSTVSFLNSANSGAQGALVSSDFSGGVAYFTVRNSATGTATFTATGSGLLSSSVTASGAITTVAGSAGAPTIGKLSTNTALVAGTTSGQNNSLHSTYSCNITFIGCYRYCCKR